MQREDGKEIVKLFRAQAVELIDTPDSDVYNIEK